MAVGDAPMSMPPGQAPPPTFVPPPEPVAQGQPAQSQPQQQQQQGPPPPGAYPAGAPMPVPPPVTYAATIPTYGLPGYIMRPPRVNPQPGMVVVGYETSSPEVGCCKCEDLNTAGWLIVILLVLIFFPLAWIPCLVESLHDPSCRPVYGWPQQQQQQPQQQYQQYQQPQQYPIVAPTTTVNTVNPKPQN